MKGNRWDESTRSADAAVGPVQEWARQSAESGLVSVVIPVFNGAEFLRDALESVRRQNYQRWEVVVVDDGSTDQSRSIAEAVAAQEPRVRSFHQDNAGHSAARNRGLIECRGEYVQFLDADDRLCPTKLSDQVRHLEQHPDIDIVTGEARYFSVRGQTPPMDAHPPAQNFLADLLVRNVMCINSPLTRRTVLARIGGFKSRTARGARVYGCEDWDLWLRAGLSGCKIAYVPVVVVHNYWHENNTQHDRVRMLESALWALRENAGAVSLRYKPWWVLSVLEKQAHWVAVRYIDGTRADWILRGLRRLKRRFT